MKEQEFTRTYTRTYTQMNSMYPTFYHFFGHWITKQYKIIRTWPPGAGAPTEFAIVCNTSMYNCSFSSGVSIKSSFIWASCSFSGNISARVSAVRTADIRRLSRFHESAVNASKYPPSVSWMLCIFFFFFEIKVISIILNLRNFGPVRIYQGKNITDFFFTRKPNYFFNHSIK